MSNKFVFNNELSGKNIQVNQGEVNNPIQNNTSSDDSNNDVFDYITHLIKEKSEEIGIELDQQECEVVIKELRKTAVKAEEFVDDIDIDYKDAGNEDSLVDSDLLVESDYSEIEKESITAIDQFRSFVSKHGEKLGRAICKGSIAALKATMSSNPVIAGLIAFLNEFSK